MDRSEVTTARILQAMDQRDENERQISALERALMRDGIIPPGKRLVGFSRNDETGKFDLVLEDAEQIEQAP